MGDKGCETGIGVDCDDVNSGVWGISWFEFDAHLISGRMNSNQLGVCTMKNYRLIFFLHLLTFFVFEGCSPF